MIVTRAHSLGAFPSTSATAAEPFIFPGYSSENRYLLALSDIRRDRRSHGGKPGGEVSESNVLIVLLLEIPTLPGPFIEIQRIAEWIIIECPMPMGAYAAPAPVESPNESFPLGAGDDLGPLTCLLESPDTACPPPVVVLAGCDAFPEGWPEARGPAVGEAWEAEAAVGVVLDRGGWLFVDRKLRFLGGHGRSLGALRQKPLSLSLV